MKPNANVANKSVAWFGRSVGSNYLQALRKKLQALAGDTTPDVEAAVENPRVLVQACIRRDVDPSLTLLGTRQRGAVALQYPADAGYGELLTMARAEIKRERNLHAIAPGTHVATVLVDLDAWEYDVVYEVLEESPLRADGGLECPRTQGWIREDEAGQYVVCAGVDERLRPCRGRMRLDEAASDETRWVWTCPDCDERLIQGQEGRR